MVGAVVLVHDVEEGERKNVSREEGFGVPVSVDEYVALAHGPDQIVGSDGNYNCGEEERSSRMMKNKKRRSCFGSDLYDEETSSDHELLPRDSSRLHGRFGSSKMLALLVLCVVAAVAVVLMVGSRSGVTTVWEKEEDSAAAIMEVVSWNVTRHRSGVAAAVASAVDVEIPYPKRRTAFHVRPPKNWMSDPCGPMYFNGVYHIFYQYNRDGAYWGNMSWGHSVSRDLIHWTFLGCNLEPSEWYDIHGSWSGSITLIDGVPTALYTGWTNNWDQVQAIAYPKNLSDPLLREWVKYEKNPVLGAPAGTASIKDFRDPSVGFKGGDGQWRVLIGSRLESDGVAMMFKSQDFIHWDYVKTLFYTPKSGMWECIELFPIAVFGQPGLNESVHGPDVRYMFKASLEDRRHDFYGLGHYDTYTDTFFPDDPENPIPYRYNNGKFFASKSFFDTVGLRRIAYGFVNESDPPVNDIAKGWNTILGTPITVWLDGATNKTIISQPIEEVKQLRSGKVSKKAVLLAPGTVELVEGAVGDQLDIEVVFEKPDLSNEIEGKEGAFGPFGLLVLADKQFQEQSALYFYISFRKDEGWVVEYVSDPSRSTLAKDIDTTSYSANVLVLPYEDFLSARILVDRTVIESFVQGGRMPMNTRSYPTVAYDSNAYVFVFNNGTKPVTLRNLDVWQMESAGDGDTDLM